MCNKVFQLVKPSDELVEKYNLFWNKNIDEISEGNRKVKLFEEVEIDVRDYLDQALWENGVKDDKIIKFYKEGNIKSFLKEINSVYHTRLNVKDFKDISKEWLDKNNVDGLVKKCKEDLGKKAYSFSTKVYSFINPEEYPIMDRYASTILWEYIKDDEKYKGIKSKDIFGKYDEYIKAYDYFRDKYNLNNWTYKEIDIFFWTYAVLIEKYWEKQGVMIFESVIYKEQ